MEHGATGNPALVLALAAAAGILAQAVARHLKIPGIILLLLAGVLLGPDLLGWVVPGQLGQGLFDVVGFAVAVILFEGGMNLNLRRLRREGRTIRQLITVGAAVTTVGGTLAARFLMGWDWRVSLLFGTLVVVTGPTVINPLLKRLKVQRSVATVLEAEGVLIDALGAVVAVVALEVALSSGGEGLGEAVWSVALRLGAGTLFGLVWGLALAWLLRWRDLVPEGLENVAALSLVLVLYLGANQLLPESGIAAVVVAGIVLGNVKSHAQRGLLEFKEQLTVLLIGLLFVLLAADVRMAHVVDLGWRGAAVVVALIVVVRPLDVFAGTLGSNLTWRQRAFMAWMGPRGIVAAAVASLFAVEMSRNGLPGGTELRALVFLVIASTVLTAGFTGGGVARLLRLQRPTDWGWMILGANDLGRLLAGALKARGEEVVLIDANPDSTQAAQDQGLKVIYGNGLQDRTLQRAEVDTRTGAVGLTPNEEVNLLFVDKVRQEGRLKQLLVALKTGQGGVTREMVRAAGGQVLFGSPQDVPLWSQRIRRDAVSLLPCRLEEEGQEAGAFPHDLQAEGLLLPLLVRREGRWRPAASGVKVRPGEEAVWLVHSEGTERAVAWLREQGWRPLEEGADPAPEAGTSPVRPATGS